MSEYLYFVAYYTTRQVRSLSEPGRPQEMTVARFATQAEAEEFAGKIKQASGVVCAFIGKMERVRK